MRFVLVRRMVAVFFFFFFTAAHADAARDLTQLLNGVQSMQANFTQTIYDNRGKAIQQASGRMALARPGKFRWQVVKPTPQLIVANGLRLWVYDPDLEQVTIRALNLAAGETPALLLSHDNSDTLDKEFKVVALPDQSGQRWFSLTPKKSDNTFEVIKMGFSHHQINEMQLQDSLGHTTKIQFTDAKTNLNLSPTLFTFKPPAKVDIIDETTKK